MAIPIGAVVGVLTTYGLLMLKGMDENEGRRGLLAGVVGLVPGAVMGFVAASAGVRWIQSESDPPIRGLLAGIMTAMLAGVFAGMVGFVLGIRFAEARGISHQQGKRWKWSLFFVALPVAVLTAILGFLLGALLVTMGAM